MEDHGRYKEEIKGEKKKVPGTTETVFSVAPGVFCNVLYYPNDTDIGSGDRMESCFFYSCRSASIGFIFAAFTDGINPNITPISVENTTAMTIAVPLIATGAVEIPEMM